MLFTYIADKLSILLGQNDLRCFCHRLVLDLVNVLPVVLLRS